MDQTGNHILDNITLKELEALRPHLRPVKLNPKTTLIGQNEPATMVYFITAGFVSLLSHLEDGSTVEIALIGSEGMTNINVILGSDTVPQETMAQATGTALQMNTDILLQFFETQQTLRRRLLRFAQAVMVHTGQSAACNARHNVENRLARWLLMAQDRINSDNLPLTQDFLATMLGIRRQGVAEAAGILQNAGIIRYKHGIIKVVDRKKLEDTACECYGNLIAEYRKLLS